MTDIVTRLRHPEFTHHAIQRLAEEAAAEIERMRASDGWAMNERLRIEIERLRADNEHWQQIAGQGIVDEHALRVEIAQLRKEIERLRAALDNEINIARDTLRAEIERLRALLRRHDEILRKDGDH